MARVPEYPTVASPGLKTMTRTIYCPQCGVVLNVPESAAGRKLRCPKCATKFAAPSAAASPGDSVIAESSPSSSTRPTRKGPSSSGDFGLPTTRRDSSGSIELPTLDASVGDFDLPISSGPLRDSFDLPLLDDIPPPRSSPSQAKPKVKAPTAPAQKAPRAEPKAPAPVADALALFQDEPRSNRKLTGAEARAKARRCPSCGGVVGIGMSLCNTCGLDLDTGRRITPLDVFEDEMPAAPRDETPSLGLMFVGGLCAMINLLVAVATLVAWANGAGAGMLLIMIVWLFGIYASVQFLRRKAIRPLFLALALGVGIGVVYLIALPIWDANNGTAEVATNTIIAPPPVDPSNPEVTQVRNLAEELDMNKIAWGIAVLLAYAALSVYLNSPSMRREFTKR